MIIVGCRAALPLPMRRGPKFGVAGPDVPGLANVFRTRCNRISCPLVKLGSPPKVNQAKKNPAQADCFLIRLRRCQPALGAGSANA